MKLVAKKRMHAKKSDLSAIRQAKNIPAVLYGKNQTAESIEVDGKQFHSILNSVKKGFLSNTVLTLECDGKQFEVLVKEIQYHKVTYDVLHLDLQVLEDAVPVTLPIPIRFIGQEVCAGIKQGGYLRKVKRSLTVRCLPKDIPAAFDVDISALELKQAARVKNIMMPDTVRSFVSKETVVAVIDK